MAEAIVEGSLLLHISGDLGMAILLALGAEKQKSSRL